MSSEAENRDGLLRGFRKFFLELAKNIGLGMLLGLFVGLATRLFMTLLAFDQITVMVVSQEIGAGIAGFGSLISVVVTFVLYAGEIEPEEKNGNFD